MFQGFSDATTDFLWGVRFNNEREWFQAHKQEYLDHLWTPFRALAGEVYDGFMEKHPKLPLALHVSRIYRDARRLFGRGPYKDFLWFSIRQNGEEWYEHPVFWFEINPEGYAYGMGVYSPHPELMAASRREIDEHPRRLTTLANRLNAQERFVLEGEEYARKKGSPKPPLDAWYNRKAVDLVCRRGIDHTLNSPELVPELIDAYDFLTPYYQYFSGLAAGVLKENRIRQQVNNEGE